MHSTRRTLSQRQKGTRAKCARAIMLMICALWLTSCTTTRTNSPAPHIYAPDPFNESGEMILKYVKAGETVTAQDDSVIMPYWYWEKIFDYIVDTQAAQEIAAANKTTPEK